MQVRSGMAPLLRLRARLAAMRNGTARRVEGDYPAEVQPLVDDLNALLDDREQRVARALAKAGDLAHGLKTPLAVMTREAERVAEGGDDELSGTLSVKKADGSVRMYSYGFVDSSSGLNNECSVWQALWAYNRNLSVGMPD